jgi:hypothetical protein
MAHPAERRQQLRGLYIYKRLSMEAACGALGIGKATGIRWRADALERGDDWDQLRTAQAMGDENFSTLSRQLLEDYLTQHQATLDMLREDKEMSPITRARLLASLSDSFNKTMASFRRVAPELNKHAVALDTLQRLATFAQAQKPALVPALLELLEPFGQELAKSYG